MATAACVRISRRPRDVRTSIAVDALALDLAAGVLAVALLDPRELRRALELLRGVLAARVIVHGAALLARARHRPVAEHAGALDMAAVGSTAGLREQELARRRVADDLDLLVGAATVVVFTGFDDAGIVHVAHAVVAV